MTTVSSFNLFFPQRQINCWQESSSLQGRATLQLLGPSATFERAGSKLGAFVRAAFALGLEHCLTSRFGTVTSQEMRHLPAIALNFASKELLLLPVMRSAAKIVFLLKFGPQPHIFDTPQPNNHSPCGS